MDDLLDLDLLAPAKPTSASSTQNAARSNPQAAYGGGRTTFDYLSRAGRPSSSSSSTTPSPSFTPRSRSPFQPTPASATAAATPRTKSPAPNASTTDDAFSSLFSSSGSGSGSAGSAASHQPMSMAERLAKENAARFGGDGTSHTSNWSTLSPTSAATSSSLRSASPALQNKPSPSMNSTTTASSDPWDFDMLAKSTPSVARPSTSSAALDPFDLGFDAPPPSPSTRPKPSRLTPMSAAHFGHDGDDPFGTSVSLLSGGEEGAGGGGAQSADLSVDDFDLLGAFSQPAARRPPPSSSTTTAHRSPAPPARTASPPPHILGQIVQMGFSIPQAQAALGATVSPSGEWRVEQALEVLIEQQQAEEAGSGRPVDRNRESARAPAPTRDNGWGSDEEEDARRKERRRREAEQDDGAGPRSPATAPTGRRAREAAAAAAAARISGQPPLASDDPAGDAVAAAQRQANELLAQASKIGFSMFKSANAYYAAGKAQLQKALDERAAAEEAAGESGGGSSRKARQTNSRVPPGRPKWWTEDMEDEGSHEVAAAAAPRSRAPADAPPPTSFQDSDDEEILPQRPSQPSGGAAALHPSAMAPRASASRTPASAAPPAVAQVAAAAAAYVSPWRRTKAQPAAADSLPVPQQSAARATTPTPQRAPTPARTSYPPRAHVSVSASDLASSSSHKNKGNDLFKLGRFGDASVEYTNAIDALPSNTLHLVPLLNNRATARLKVGEERLAAEDSSTAISILLTPYGGVPKQAGQRIDIAALEAEKLPTEVGELKLVDQLGKALGKRAKANEVNEKWSAAAEDWALALGAGGDVVRAAGGMKVVSDGVTRCRKMLAGPSQPAASGAPATRPKPAVATPAARPHKPVVQVSGEAVKALKAAHQASEAEDDLRLSLKDSVDAKIMGWKGGKENNLRALIASLDSVLWPELEWKKVGMHELISEGQLKVRYVRAIAKVHPDKLNVQNTTVEQRMVAGLVFAALNDAWNAQKA